ncbi:MAG: TRAP transporter substrate-binding protein DctP [Synergistaceae bacterium]|nr:TRAP transporter substrate-binding protein DctP [Synergistaceae bacterium]
MKKGFVSLCCLLVCAALVLGSLPAQAAPRVLKFSSASPATSTWQLGAEKFVVLVSEKLGDKFDFVISPSDQLSGGNQVAGIELLQTGVTDVHLHDALVWSAVAKKSIVPCFPWLLPTYDDVDKYMKGEGGAALKQVLNDAGVVCLAIGENGYRQVVNNRNPIRLPTDMKGLKMRVPGSSVHVALLKYIGADPITMNQSEVYTSLQQGTIDACENTLDLLFTQNTLEVTKYISLWNYSYDPIFLSVSRELWESLSDEEKAVFQSAADEAMSYQVVVTREKEKELKRRLPEYKMDVVEALTPDEVAAFKKAVKPVYDDNYAEFKDLFEKFGYKQGN